jgi:hypothetical protein
LGVEFFFSETHYMFHKSFLDILRGTDPLCKYDLSEFDSIDFDLLPRTSNGIIKIAPILLRRIKREQELIETDKDYYIGKDLSTGTIYMCFRDLMMIDIDIAKTEIDANDILSKFEKSDKCFRIFKSTNGYHAFCISERFDYRKPETLDFMLEYNSDFYYIVYCYIRGFSVRLNKKFFEKTDKLYVDMGLFGNTEVINLELNKLVDKHISYISDTININ